MCRMMTEYLNNSIENNTVFDIAKYFESKSDALKAEERKDIILIFSYSVIIFISLIGNLLVCKVVYDLRQSLSTTNVLIVNLSISDLLMTTVNIPFNIVRFILPNWPFGQLLCVLVPFIQSVSVHVSSITMMFIAFERYKSLIHNSHIDCKCLGERFRFFGILLLIWLLSAVFSIPHGIHNKVRPLFSWLSIVRCQVVYPEPKIRYNQWYSIISLMTQYIIPITLTLICYVRISQFLWRRQIVGNVNECHRIGIMRKKKRRIRMLLIVVFVFAICWLPLNIYLIVNAFIPNFFTANAFFTCHWFAMSSVCYNPFIYCWLNENFRRSFKKLFSCCSCLFTANGRPSNIPSATSSGQHIGERLEDCDDNNGNGVANDKTVTQMTVCSPNNSPTNIEPNSETFV